jgi:hypothetical protein
VQAAVELGVGRLELVPDLGLGPSGDLAPDPLPAGSEANRDRPDEAVLRRVEVDRILAVTATATCSARHVRERNSFLGSPFGSPLREPIPERGSELVVRGSAEPPTFRFSGALSSREHQPGKAPTAQLTRIDAADRLFSVLLTRITSVPECAV